MALLGGIMTIVFSPIKQLVGKNNLIVFIVFLIFAQDSFAGEDSLNCSELNISEITTEKSKLESNLLPIILEQPEVDAKKRISHGDFRFIAVQGEAFNVPEVTSKENFKAICRYGVKEISGLTPSPENSQHFKLMIKFKEYISKYNIFLLNYYKQETR